MENKQATIFRDFPVQTDIQVLDNRPDIILLDHQKKTGFIINMTVPKDENIEDKEMEELTITSL